MTDSTSQKPSVLFWIISVIALLWNGMGVNHYLQQAYKTDSFKAMYPNEKLLEMVMNTPGWVMGAFAIAVFFGLLGSIAMLLRKKWANILYLISLLGIIAQLIYNVFMSGALEVYGPGAVIMPIMILIFGLILYFYSKKMIERGVLS